MVVEKRSVKSLFRSALMATVMLLSHGKLLVANDDWPVVQVATGVFFHEGVHEMMAPENLGAIGNMGFIVGGQSVAVIDPGGSLEAGRRLRLAIEKVTDLPVEYLVLTHFHPDHVAGAMAFAETPTVIAHANYSRAMAQRAQFYLDRFSTLLPGNVAQVFRLPTQTVPEGESVDIDLGGRVLTVEAHSLAHTDNDVTVHDRQTDTLWASDLVFAQRAPSLDGSLLGWLDVMSLLDTRSYSLIVPGHGSPAPWLEVAAPQRAYLESLRDNVRKFIEQGKSLAQVLAQHEKYGEETVHWQLYDEQHGTNLAKSYTELEWE